MPVYFGSTVRHLDYDIYAKSIW